MGSDPTVARLRAAGCVFAEEEAALLREAAGPGSAEEDLEALVARRVNGEPLEIVLGWADFAGVRVHLDPGVFVPRQRTAFLVERAADLAGHGVLAADLCCGSGAIALALLARRPDLTVVAADLDPVAAACAARNLRGRADVCAGDLYDALPAELAGRLGLVTANVPYVPSGDIALLPPEAREHEPRMALDGGQDGLDLVARVAEGAATWLASGGSVLVEVAVQQAESASRAFTRVGLGVVAERDEESRTVVIVGTRR